MDSVIMILLNYLNGAVREDTNTSIARTILNNINQFKNYSLVEASDACNVSESTTKRFCQIIGFKTYSHLKYSMNIEEIIAPSSNASNLDLVQQNFQYIEAIDRKLIHMVNQQINKHQHIVLIGYGDFLYPALYYQKQMFSLGKLIEVKHFLSNKILD